MTGHGIAFFDVDETLVSVRTLEAFLFHYLKRAPEMVSPEQIAGLREQVITLERTEFNRRYFALWAGRSAEEVRAAGREWFAAASATPGFFRANVLARLRAHQDAGTAIVLVSGSFAAPLAPLAEAVGADALHCTRLESDADGRLTGRIATPMLGDDKRRVVEELIARDPAASTWAYGDHESDLPLLESVDHATVVGDDPALARIAADHGWPVLPIDQPLAPRTSAR